MTIYRDSPFGCAQGDRLNNMWYAIVDIETTGGHAASNGITEVSDYLHDGTQIVGHYETLINPGQHIPYYITGLTGITNEMVMKAPPFSEVAERIFTLLQDNVFVAHSVNFDYSFIRHQLSECGYELNTKSSARSGSAGSYSPARPPTASAISTLSGHKDRGQAQGRRRCEGYCHATGEADRKRQRGNHQKVPQENIKRAKPATACAQRTL